MLNEIYWTAAEDLLIDRYVRDLAVGRFRSAHEAARACEDERQQLHRDHPESPRAATPRTYKAIESRIRDRARASGARWPTTRWSPEEYARIRPYVDGLVRGAYPSATEAARRCLGDTKRRAGRVTPSQCRPLAFCLNTLELKIRELAAKQGWQTVWARHWSPQELRILDGYGRKLKRGRYPTATVAAQAYLQDLDRLQHRYPRAPWLSTNRTLVGVTLRLVKRMKQLKSWPGRLWTEPELRLLEPYAQRVADGRCPTAAQAASDFLRTQQEVLLSHPDNLTVQRRCSLDRVKAKILKRANELGRVVSVVVPWGSPELAILNRYARAVVRRRYRSASEAAPDCLVELADVHRLHPDTGWGRLTRDLLQIRGRLQRHLHAFGVPRAWGGWTPGERSIVERFAGLCTTGRRGEVSAAARACVRELERSYRRDRRRRPWLPQGQPRTFRSVKELLLELRKANCHPILSDRGT